MKISCTKSDLLKSVNIARRAIPVRSTMPILECLLIDAAGSDIHLLANDMELGIDTILAGTVLEKGKVAVEANLFGEIIRKLPDAEVTVTTDEKNVVTILCDKASFTLGGQNAAEFPLLPDITRDEGMKISQFTLRNMIQQTIFSIAQNDHNPLMAGELIECDNDLLRIVSLDGNRISIRRVELKDSGEKKKVVVAGKTLAELTKIIGGGIDDDVQLYFMPNHIVFEMPETIVVSRLVEGEYFAIDQMISRDYETKVVVNRNSLLNCIDRATLFVREGDKRPIILDFKDGSMNLSIESTIGAMNEDIEVEKEGKDLLIGFNPRFLLDALKAIEDENVSLYLTNAKSPCFIRDEAESYTYLILPVNFMRA